jgi:serine/threonine protein kinase/tetratricopeptide (TPR) repeat protein
MMGRIPNPTEAAMALDPLREKSIFLAAAEKPHDQRSVFLDEACGNESALRRRVEDLLEAHDRSGSFLSTHDSDQPPTASFTPATPAATAGREESGTRIGSYKLLHEIGEGGMGTVWKAEQIEPVRRLVALKVIKAGMDSRQVLARFEAERQALALMDHPHIAKVLDAGATTAGRPYFVMELVNGIPITKHCDEQKLTPRQRLELFVLVCQAIQHAHQKGIIHRDIKPSNVLVASYDSKPLPKVIDFGIAKATGQKLTEKTMFTDFGGVVGTLEYMSPEQAGLDALDIDTRSDIYSLGVLLYELLTGNTPLSRKQLRQASIVEALRLIREQEPPKPSIRLGTSEGLPSISALRKTEPARLTKMVRGELDWMVMKALDKDRTRRYETASGFGADVQRYLHDEPVEAGPPSAWYRLRKFARRNKVALRTALGAAAVLFVAVVGVGWVVRDRQAQEELRNRELSKRRLDTEQEVNVGLAEAGLLRDRAGEKVILTARDADAVVAMWLQAEATLAQAEAALRAGAADDRLQERVLNLNKQLEQGLRAAEGRRGLMQRQETLLRDLDEARMAKSTWIDNGHDPPGFDYATAAAKYGEAFTTYGLEIKPGAADKLNGQIRAEPSAVREALIVALDVWADAVALAKTQWSASELRALAASADDDDWRRKFRTAAIAKDVKSLLALSAEARALSMPAANVHLLASSLIRAPIGQGKEALALLRWAHGKYPTDFWIALELGSHLEGGEDRIRVNQPEEGTGPLPANRKWQIATPLEIEETIGCYRVALALRPQVSAVHKSLARALKAKKQLPEAIQEFRTAIALNPTDADAHGSLAETLKANNQLQDAIAAHQIACDLKPTDGNRLFNLGQALRANNQLDDAIRAFGKCVEIDPKHPGFVFGLGNTLTANHQPAKAIALFREGIVHFPKNTVIYDGLGRALAANKQWDEAIATYHEAIENHLHTNPIEASFACVYFGDFLRANKKLDDAIVAYRRAVDISPTFTIGHTFLGAALEANKQMDDAIAVYRAAIGVNPQNAGFHNRLGTVLLKNKQLEQAIAAHRKAVEYSSSNASFHHDLAATLSANSEFHHAIVVYRKAIELDPKNPARYNALAWLLATCPDTKAREPKEAVNLAKIAVDLAPKVAGFVNTLGVAYYRAGDWKSAHTTLDRSVELSEGGKCEDWFFLAMTQWRLGQEAAARQWYERAAEWMDKNQSNNDELLRFRAEATSILKAEPGVQNVTALGEAMAQFNLALNLRKQGKLDDALQAMQKSHAMGSKQPNWTLPSAQISLQLERIIELSKAESHESVAQERIRKGIQGVLGKEDPLDVFPQTMKSYRQSHAVQLKAGQSYQVDLTGDFDVFLRVEDANYLTLAINDDVTPPNNRDARLVLTPAKDGLYRLIVTSFKPAETGKYALSVSEVKQADSGRIISGEIKAGDNPLAGRFRHIHRVELVAGRPYILEVESPRFIGIVGLADPAAKALLVQSNFRSEYLRGARIDFTPMRSGTYQVVVTTNQPGEIGTYSLRIQGYEPAAEKDKK